MLVGARCSATGALRLPLPAAPGDICRREHLAEATESAVIAIKENDCLQATLATGRNYIEQAPWLARWPGLCLTLTVYSLNIFGDALRDLLDPRLRGGDGRLAAAKTRKASSSAGHR